jgi:hypothetical protein
VVLNPGALQNGQPVTLDAPVKAAPPGGTKKPKETTGTGKQKSSAAGGSSGAQ